MKNSSGSAQSDSPTPEIGKDDLSKLSQKELLIKLREEFAQAEELAKKVEHSWDKAAFPAINELRYAGQHSINFHAEIAEGKEDRLSELRRAIDHCRRASYEASDAGITNAFEHIVTFKEQYNDVVISDVLSDWVSIMQETDRIIEEHAEARDTAENRSRDHAKAMQAFETLVGFAKRTDYARDELNKKVDLYNARVKKERDARETAVQAKNIADYRFKVSTVIAILAAVIALASLLMSS